MKNNDIIRWIVVILSIMFGGFLLFSLGFSLLAIVIHVFRAQGPNDNFNMLNALLILGAYLGATLFLIYSMKVYLDDSDFKIALLATFLTLPLMLMVVSIGIVFFDHQSLVVILSSGLMLSVILFMIYKKVHTCYKIAWLIVLLASLIIYVFNVQL